MSKSMCSIPLCSVFQHLQEVNPLIGLACTVGEFASTTSKHIHGSSGCYRQLCTAVCHLSEWGAATCSMAMISPEANWCVNSKDLHCAVEDTSICCKKQQKRGQSTSAVVTMEAGRAANSLCLMHQDPPAATPQNLSKSILRIVIQSLLAMLTKQKPYSHRCI